MSETLELHAWDDCPKCRGQQQLLLVPDVEAIPMFRNSKRTFLAIKGLHAEVHWLVDRAYVAMCECSPTWDGLLLPPGKFTLGRPS